MSRRCSARTDGGVCQPFKTGGATCEYCGRGGVVSARTPSRCRECGGTHTPKCRPASRRVEADIWRGILASPEAQARRAERQRRRGPRAVLLAALLVGGFASVSSAAVLRSESGHCGCTLVELPPVLAVVTADPGYSPDLTAAEVAELRRLDDAHEPAPAAALWAWLCLPFAGPGAAPGALGAPGAPAAPTGLRVLPGGELRTVPEPSGLLALLVGAVACWRWRR